jgi:uncharacterized phiE125 gp8 family phage protein
MIDPDAIDQVLPLEDVKAHLKVEHSTDDELIQGLIYTAVEEIEGETGHLFGRRNLTEHFGGFHAVRLRAFPVHTITGVAYIDGANAPQALSLDGLRLVGGSKRPVRVAWTGTSWPSTCTAKDAVAITFDAGHEPDDVPHRLRQAALLMISDLYRNRGETSDLTKKTVPMSLTVKRILDRFRIKAL